MIDWNYLSNKVEIFLPPLNTLEIAGLNDYKVKIDLAKLELRFSNYGRYYFELDFLVEESRNGKKVESYSGLEDLITHHIEDLDYKEPHRSKELSVWMIVLIVLLWFLLS